MTEQIPSYIEIGRLPSSKH